LDLCAIAKALSVDSDVRGAGIVLGRKLLPMALLRALRIDGSLRVRLGWTGLQLSCSNSRGIAVARSASPAAALARPHREAEAAKWVVPNILARKEFTGTGARQVRTSDFGLFALTTCLAAVLLAGCGGSQPPTGAPARWPHLKWTIAGFVVIASMSLSSLALADAESQSVNLTIVSRCGASTVLEKAELNKEDGRAAADIPLTRLGAFLYSGHVTVAPGRYLVGANVRSKCWGGREITVLPGRVRNVGIEVTTLGSGHYDAHAFLYGTLPITGFVRGSLIGKGSEDPVEIDAGAYYAEHEYPGTYLLKLSYGDSLECRIPVVIPQEGMRLDISVQEAQHCLGFPYHYPATGERGFILLLPSPSPSP
jgi:hypothetical protein